ncbi:retinal guanylyl cyclase 1 [Austrofundulus limnaeus]|uniref:Guanylate cyclase n=1 Tax=Austrofundulus limnaeus TaxID=52670 RepID=A0A2I4B334_AUSLI|nr:PREDICTED: retinal guanylyl cyclase 2-like [Austrofundulus limnaeus]XP_013862141.1 PREDICTED: retinal guanylyl cyclase 2-like [Austrofundulus limnaeus]XP_013862142.1 PREDICTED: retinal guanylyl cyclase 2-like [Austrofundulus limnaeus]XP_013862143.1 PREDICTED: retinal guanylyl cyclase 2-like [Austrofundulus limnaeus]
METQRDSCCLHNLAYHPRWRHHSVKVIRKRHIWTVVTNSFNGRSQFELLSASLSLSSKPQLPSSPMRHVRGWRGSWFLIFLLVISSFPCQVQATTFKVALVGPWTCDPLYSKALPDLAARLATSRINKNPYLNKGYWYDYTLVNEDCKSTRALIRFADLESYGAAFLGPANPGYCSSAALYAKEWDMGLLSWGCLRPGMKTGDTYPTFLRPLPLSSHVLFAVLRFFQWAHVAIISEETDVWEATGQELASSLRTLGLPVSPVVTMETDREGPRRALSKVREADRVKVIIMCMPSVLIGGQAQYKLLTTALAMRMIDRGYVFIPYDTLLYSLPYKDTHYPLLGNDTKLRKAYDGVLTITMESGNRSFYEAFRDAQSSYEIRSSTPPEQVSPFFGTIYNMLYYIAMAAEQARARGGRWVTGHILGDSEGGFEFEGFNQHLQAGRKGEGMQAAYVVLDYSGMGDTLYSTHSLHATHTDGTTGGLKYLGRSIHFAGSTPFKDSSCWFSPYFACTGGTDPITLFFLFLVFVSLVGFGINTFLRLKNGSVGLNFEGDGNSGSSKVVLTLDDLVFINTQISKRKLNDDSITKSQGDMKTPHHSVSGRSYLASTPDSSNVAVFEGDWVWLKKCPSGTVSNVNSSTEVVFVKLREMRHENLNLFLGLFFDSGIFGVVTEHCNRGSLEDLLANEDVRLDWMFKSSLLMDLIRGMKYLHHRDIIHGRLKSRNCVVDGRFVLKVTDYGFNDILIAQGIDADGEKAEDLLWTAPELLRNSSLRRKGTFCGDVYSFSIVVQEVVSRSTPFCMLDMPPKEIINKVKKPPPLCRPIVSVEEAPLDVIQLVRQAWSEEPDKRPTFEEIFKQFKCISKGKKINLIDSMLKMLEQYSSNLEDLIRERTEELEVERQKTDQLVAQMLPKSVAQALKLGKPVEPEHFTEVTLYFSDIVGFTTISALSEPIEVVDLLNDLYSLFDAIIPLHDVYKVETIGDAYMVASGVPTRNGNRHAAEMANMSLDILHCIGTFKARHMPDLKIRIRIGLHSGPVVAGVVGLTMPRYCLFGDTVNTTSRMESTSLPYRIHVNETTVKLLNSLKMGYKIQVRGLTELKGKGVETTYWLVGKDDFNKSLPVPIEKKENHGVTLEEIPADRRQKFLDRQKKTN